MKDTSGNFQSQSRDASSTLTLNNHLHMQHLADINNYRALNIKRLARLDRRVTASVAGTRANLLGLVAGGGTLVLNADLLDGRSTSTGDVGDVTLVGVDSGEDLSVVGLDVLDNDVASAHLLAVTARSVELSEVNDGESINGDRSETIVLDDLVLSTGSTTALDESVTVTLEGESILADLLPPDVFDGARALTVDTLDLVSTDDGVLEGGAVLEDEDGVAVAALDLASALDATAVGLHATVESTGDVLDLLVGDGALGGGDGERSALLEGAHGVGGDIALGSGESGGGEKAGEDDGELHFEDVVVIVWLVGKSVWL